MAKPRKGPSVAKQRKRKKRVNMAALDAAIRRSPLYTSREDFINRTKQICLNTKKAFLESFELRMDCIRAIAKELEVADPNSLVVDDPSITKYSSAAESFRQFAITLSYGMHPQRDPQIPQDQNCWSQILSAEGKCYQPIPDHEKLVTMEQLCQNGFYYRAGDLDYRPQTLDRNQLERIINHFRVSAETGLRDTLAYCKGTAAAAKYFQTGIQESLKDARRSRMTGQSFRWARRQFFYTFGLELGQIAENITKLLDLTDQPRMQCRYLLKIKYQNSRQEYQKQMHQLNAPLLKELELLHEVLQTDCPDEDTAIELVRRQPGNIDSSIHKRDALLLQLKQDGALDYYYI